MREEGKVDEVGYSRKSNADNDISATILIIIVGSCTGPFEAALSIPLPLRLVYKRATAAHRRQTTHLRMSVNQFNQARDKTDATNIRFRNGLLV